MVGYRNVTALPDSGFKLLKMLADGILPLRYYMLIDSTENFKSVSESVPHFSRICIPFSNFKWKYDIESGSKP